VQYAHVIDTHSDGTPEFSYAYVHHPKNAQCVPRLRLTPHSHTLGIAY